MHRSERSHIHVFVAIIVLVCTDGVANAANAKVAELSSNESIAALTEQNDPELRQRFFDEYPMGVERLKAAVDRFRGKGRYRHRTATLPEVPWMDLSFLCDGQKRRYIRQRSTDSVRPRKATEEEALLVTPGLAARVRSPSTKWAWAEYVGGKPTPGMMVSIDIHFARILQATYCIDGLSVLDLMKGTIEGKVYVVHQVFRDAKHHDWVIVRFGFKEKADEEKFDAHGTVLIAFCPAEDWALREFDLRSEEPFNFRVRGSVDVQRVEGCGVVPLKHHREVQNLADPSKWQERIDFELTEVAKADSVDEAEFTLAALGVAAPKNTSTWLRWSMIIITAIITVLLLCIRWYSHRQGEAGVAS